MSSELQQLLQALALVRDGRSWKIGDIGMSNSADSDTLSLGMESHVLDLHRITRQSALRELHELKQIYERMLELCPNLLEIAGKHRVALWLYFGVGHHYHMPVCSEIDGHITWEADHLKTARS